jgi:hypothetical protein
MAVPYVFTILVGVIDLFLLLLEGYYYDTRGEDEDTMG